MMISLSNISKSMHAVEVVILPFFNLFSTICEELVQRMGQKVVNEIILRIKNLNIIQFYLSTLPQTKATMIS